VPPHLLSCEPDLLLISSGPSKGSPFEMLSKMILRPIDGRDFNGNCRSILITQDLGAELQVYVSNFVPSGADKTAYTWTDDRGTHSMKMPPFCLAATKLDQIIFAMRKYVDDICAKQLYNFGCSDTLIDTFQIALRAPKVLQCAILSFRISLTFYRTL
jgi:hypothetical protein